MTPTVIFLIGPTASGKSAASLALAQHWPVEIIAMDSATIYRGMNIGTAKPDATEQARVPHHLLDILDPAQSYDVASFVQDSLALINDIRQRGRLAVICGGTMMYYHALTRGLSPLPRSCPQMRAELEAEAAQYGWPALHQMLAQHDPQAAQRIAPNDSQRIQRALEVFRLTGTPLSILQKQPRQKLFHDPYLTLSLEPARRQLLHPRIAKRFHQMIEQGLIDEVRQLHARDDLHIDLPAIRCVGYRQIWRYLDGALDRTTAIVQGIHATEQLAKRQTTWLRSFDERQVIDCLQPDAPAQVIDKVRTQLGKRI
ncbi:MAG TPA: tRNA (adenosine(37)-N6)-dimethylallyltransferase MiaA [Paenalcaligenes sp.]|nr:tRNA (adenosine(37)-N6)-dimethylallyltransferase MiaA [Paenalcaligenes sp.]